MAKIHTETYKLPAYWASYLINGDSTGLEDGEDKDIDAWLEARPWLGGCLSVDNEEEFAWSNDATDLGGSVADFTFPVNVYKTVHMDPFGVRVKYLIYPAEVKEEMLPWQKQGLQYTASGYGRKIPTSKVLWMFGRKYRIYCSIFSNIGSCYIIYKGEKVVVE